MGFKFTAKVHRERFTEQINGQAIKALDTVGVFMVRELQKVVGIPVTKVKGVVTQRSKPGEPPRKDTGLAQSLIRYEIVTDDKGNPKLQMGIGRNAWYLPFLEAKRSRPWLVATMIANKAKIAAIIKMVCAKK